MDQYLAQVIMFGGNFAPLGWAYCNGSLQSIANNTALFSLLGTTYGGDGQTTFGLPDLRGREAIGTGQGPGLPVVDLGELSGSNSVSLTNNTMPSHNHTINVPTSNSSGSSNMPNGKILATANSSIYATTANASGSYGGATTSPVGNNIPIDIRTPYLGMNFIICVEGIFPSRN